jgi:hypothetical protein
MDAERERERERERETELIEPVIILHTICYLLRSHYMLRPVFVFNQIDPSLLCSGNGRGEEEE